MNSSHKVASLDEQSANFPGRFATSNAPLRRVNSRALRAASRAAALSTTFCTTIFATAGCSSKYSATFSPTRPSTALRTSEETSLSFVCELNLGSGTLTERTHVKPSRQSSPVNEDVLPFLIRPLSCA